MSNPMCFLFEKIGKDVFQRRQHRWIIAEYQLLVLRLVKEVLPKYTRGYGVFGAKKDIVVDFVAEN